MSATDDVLIFANPDAGRGSARRVAERLARRLDTDRLAVRTIFEPAAIDDDRHPPPRAAIAIGGDGTLRAVAAAMLAAYPTAPPPLLFIPMGTANLMARHLALDWRNDRTGDAVASAIHRRHVVHLDAATANGELFLLMAGVGFDAMVVHELARIRRGPINLASYALPAALAAATYRYPAIRVTADGRTIWPGRPGLAFVANVPEYGTGFPILPNARADDGLLDLCVLPCEDRRQLLSLALRAAAGEHLQHEGAVYARAKRVRIEAVDGAAVPLQLDGDAAGFVPVEIDLLPSLVPFIVPG